jgi:hypothetical protein
VAVTTAEPRLFGVTPPSALFGLGGAGLVASAFLLVTARWLAGGLALAATVLLFAAFVEVARRKPDGAVARASVGAFGRVRARAGYTVDALAARSRARRDLMRLRRELLELDGDRERALRELGEAVYEGDRKGTKRLRAELAELDARSERKEAEMTTLAAETREQLERARLQVRPTEMVEIPEPPRPPEPSPNPSPEPATPVPEPGPAPVPEPGPTPVPEPYPPPDEGNPPEPARIPEPGPLGDADGKK